MILTNTWPTIIPYYRKIYSVRRVEYHEQAILARTWCWHFALIIVHAQSHHFKKHQNPFDLTLPWSCYPTSNNQRLQKWVRCVLLLYNWYMRVFFFFSLPEQLLQIQILTTDPNLALLTCTIKQIYLAWHRIDTSMSSRLSASQSPRWQHKPEMT